MRHIYTTSGQIRRALLLTLTASVGQMSNMVFAITGRGKTNGAVSEKVEVGSWVIGYWCPPLHFEISVWNCLHRRAQKLLKALRDLRYPRSFSPVYDPQSVISEKSCVALLNDDSIEVLKRLPESSVAFVLTDPPHSDRIPYLELSELWNAILGLDSDFDREIVVSNARERGKTVASYNKQMGLLVLEIDRILKPGGILALLFNGRDSDSWNSLLGAEKQASLSFFGCFPMSYSANSVVQDNREGAMKSDYVLLYQKIDHAKKNATIEKEIEQIPGWSKDFPKEKGKENALHISVG